MPPKKKKDKTAEVELVDYSVDAMNSSELKEYARMLERDIEAMRNFCNFYQKAGDKLGDVYRTRLEELKGTDDMILAKDADMERIRFKVEQKIREEKDWAAYDAFTNDDRKNRLEIETSERLERGTRQHIIELDNLKKMLKDKERELMAENRKFQMKRNDALEKNSEQMEGTDKDEKNLFEKSVQAFMGMLEDTNNLNRLALESIVTETLEAKRRSEQQFKESCESYKERLQKYYKDITKEDLDAIRKLTAKAEEMEADIKASQIRLRSVQLQNEQLKSEGSRHKGPPKYVPKNSENHQRLMMTRKACNLKKIEQLRVENERLKNEINLVEEQADNLRRQFSQALYRVRQSAELKVKILWKKLEQNQNTPKGEEQSSFSTMPGICEAGAPLDEFENESS